MAQKYEIYHEVGWDETKQSAVYERLTTLKNEQSAIAFINDIENIGKHGNMLIKLKAKGSVWSYNEKSESWDKEE